MRGHLERCAECRAFADEVAAITFALRAARDAGAPDRRPGAAALRSDEASLASRPRPSCSSPRVSGPLRDARPSPRSSSAAQPVHAPMASTAPDAFLRNLRLLSLRQSASRSIGVAKSVLRATA